MAESRPCELPVGGVKPLGKGLRSSLPGVKALPVVVCMSVSVENPQNSPGSSKVNSEEAGTKKMPNPARATSLGVIW